MANTKQKISRKRYGYRVVGRHSNRVIETGTMTKKIIVLFLKKVEKKCV